MDDFTACAGYQFPARGGRRTRVITSFEPLSQRLHLSRLLNELAFKRLDALGELDDCLNAGKVDALLLGEVLDPAQHRNVTRGVAPPAPARAHRRDEAKPIVGAQGLRVHAGQLGGNGDDVVLLAISRVVG